jgi:hypothetical protein
MSRIPHTRKYLEENVIALAPIIRKIIVSYNTKGAGHTGARFADALCSSLLSFVCFDPFSVLPVLFSSFSYIRHFLRQFVPPIKYHNQNVVVERAINPERGAPSITVATGELHVCRLSFFTPWLSLSSFLQSLEKFVPLMLSTRMLLPCSPCCATSNRTLLSACLIFSEIRVYYGRRDLFSKGT